MAPAQLSREAYDRLSTELQELTTVGRTQIANAIEAARALGDLSENGDYHAAKDAQGHMEARIRKLEALLEGVEIVDATASDSVIIGSVVGLRYDGDDDVEQYLVGSIEERRDGIEVASPESPLGNALLGRKVGDTAEYQTPTGATLKIEIVEIN
ncbi:MAG TPA: transcription elongation factor GreA [Acidimicrobiales bacterium]|nr:transcription elongation factor GreA [Acidimicrobiales bacterium]